MFLKKGMFLANPRTKTVFLTGFEINGHPLNPMEFYKNDFFLQNQNPWNFCQGICLSWAQMQLWLKDKISLKPSISWDSLNESDYKNQFHYLKDKIECQRIQKGVPFGSMHGTMNDFFGPLQLLFCLQIMFENPLPHVYPYGWWDFDLQQGLVGLSPELLFEKTDDKNIRTLCLAGTKSPQMDEQDDAKLRQEHALVIEDLCVHLKHLGEISLGKTDLMHFSTLSHYKTDVYLQWKDETPFEFEAMLQGVFPSAAIGVFPKEKGLFFLKEMDQLFASRGNYACPFGVRLLGGDALAIACLRGMHWNGPKVWIPAGGGIISQSIYEQEVQEILVKIASVQKGLRLT